MSQATEEDKLSEPVHSKVYRIPEDKTELLVSDLSVFSVYQVNMWAENAEGGRSVRTYTVKVITHLAGDSSPHPTYHTPDMCDSLSNTRQNTLF